MYARAYKSQILVDDKSIHLLWHKNKEATRIYLDIFPTVHIVIHRKTSWFGHKAFMIRASIKSSTLTFKHSTCCSSNIAIAAEKTECTTDTVTLFTSSNKLVSHSSTQLLQSTADPNIVCVFSLLDTTGGTQFLYP